jgi:hypothetical protein
MDIRFDLVFYVKVSPLINCFKQACFEVSDVQSNIKNTGMSAARSVLGSFSYDQVSPPIRNTSLFLRLKLQLQVISDRNELNKRLKIVIGSSIAVKLLLIQSDHLLTLDSSFRIGVWSVQDSRFKPSNRRIGKWR